MSIQMDVLLFCKPTWTSCHTDNQFMVYTPNCSLEISVTKPGFWFSPSFSKAWQSNKLLILMPGRLKNSPISLAWRDRWTLVLLLQLCRRRFNWNSTPCSRLQWLHCPFWHAWLWRPHKKHILFYYGVNVENAEMILTAIRKCAGIAHREFHEHQITKRSLIDHWNNPVKINK